MSIIENILYGFISGLTEFLPVSSRAHQVLLRYMFGAESRNPLQDFLVHIGLLISIFVGCWEIISRLRREQKAISGSRYRKNRSLDLKSYYDLRLLKTAAFPLIIGLFLTFLTWKKESTLLSVMVFLIINASVLLLAEHTRHGNRDARTMTGLDGIVMGILGSLSAFSGISRTGMISAYATVRGADSKNVVNWTFLLGIPALVFLICFDLFSVFTLGAGFLTFSIFLGYVLAGISAFCGGYFAIAILQMILSHHGFAHFAYYSIGTALFSFVLYLIT